MIKSNLDIYIMEQAIQQEKREEFISSFRDKIKETEIYIQTNRPYQVYLKRIKKLILKQKEEVTIKAMSSAMRIAMLVLKMFLKEYPKAQYDFETEK